MTRHEAEEVITTYGGVPVWGPLNWNTAVEKLMAESIEDFNWLDDWAFAEEEIKKYNPRIAALERIIHGE